MTHVKYSLVTAILVLALLSCNCPLFVPEITIELSDLKLCRGWDVAGEPMVFSENPNPDDTRICICGHLETNVDDVYLQIFWSREKTNLLRHRQDFRNGPFLSCIEQDEGFEPGYYSAVVIAGKRELGRVDFTVGEGR